MKFSKGDISAWSVNPNMGLSCLQEVRRSAKQFGIICGCVLGGSAAPFELDRPFNSPLDGKNFKIEIGRSFNNKRIKNCSCLGEFAIHALMSFDFTRKILKYLGTSKITACWTIYSRINNKSLAMLAEVINKE